MIRRQWRQTGLALFIGVLAGVSLPVVEAAAQAGGAKQKAQAPGQFAPRGAETCMKCHDKPPTTLILRTPHAQKADKRTPFAAQQCESCHGASPQHLVKPEKGKKRAPTAIVFGQKSATSVARQNKVCLSCHESGLRMHWKGSEHDFSDVSCAGCHRVHTLKDKVLVKKTQARICFACHAEQRAQSFLRSRHPIREGKVVCTNCHNPHGSAGPTLLVKKTVNETCYQCHAEKRGPFLWEHAPVREECTLCHTPHGSVQPRLLRVRTPFLCQTCHSEAFHPSTLRSGTGVPPVGAGDRLLGKGCLNCHSKIHGSNHPSGPRFTR